MTVTPRFQRNAALLARLVFALWLVAGMLVACGGGAESTNSPAPPPPPPPPPANTPPTISGSPATSVNVGQAYSFTPAANDVDSDPLTFSIVNRPGWAAFDAGSGELSGSPASGDVGSYSNIRISVSDGMATASLPEFTIDVNSNPPGNTPPTISGTPSTTATVGQPYAFMPAANDADNDPLTFSIVNQPGWAMFDSGTGALTGTPASGDIGSYLNISISVSDGVASASLPSFSIDVAPPPPTSVLLTWTAPTLNEDMTQLDDLAGFRVRWGTQSGNYPNVVPVNDPTATSATVPNLSSGTYFFVVTAIDTSNNESVFSDEASAVIP